MDFFCVKVIKHGRLKVTLNGWRWINDWVTAVAIFNFTLNICFIHSDKYTLGTSIKTCTQTETHADSLRAEDDE